MNMNVIRARVFFVATTSCANVAPCCILPLLIGDSIPEDDERWSNFLTLMEIVDLLFSAQVVDTLLKFVMNKDFNSLDVIHICTSWF